MKGVLAIILAGGRGKRMGILRQKQAKPTLPLGSKKSYKEDKLCILRSICIPMLSP